MHKNGTNAENTSRTAAANAKITPEAAASDRKKLSWRSQCLPESIFPTLKHWTRCCNTLRKTCLSALMLSTLSRSRGSGCQFVCMVYLSALAWNSYQRHLLPLCAGHRRPCWIVEAKMVLSRRGSYRSLTPHWEGALLMQGSKKCALLTSWVQL